MHLIQVTINARFQRFVGSSHHTHGESVNDENLLKNVALKGVHGGRKVTRHI